MEITQIINQVESPFTDELIQKLIEKYISCGCNDNLFYSEINNLGIVENGDNQSTKELIRHIFNTGVNKYDLYAEQVDSQFIYEYNDAWITVSSEQDPLKENQRYPDDKRPVMYRVYLNIKDKEKSKFILDYINKCKANNLPYKFKFSREDGRSDQIVLLSSLENFGENLSIIEELTSNLQLGNVPLLIGKYKDGIGIAEEFYNRLYSPTKAKLALVRSSVKKYLCDHKDEFYENLSNENKEEIDGYIEVFSFLYNMRMEDKEDMGEEYEDLEKNYYQMKSSIECAKEHIENDRDAYACGEGLLALGGAIKQIYSSNPAQFIHEVTQNYRIIGTQVWGFSNDFVFSNETEAMVVQQKALQQRENELSALEAEAREYDVAEALIGKLEQRQGEDIGE